MYDSQSYELADIGDRAIALVIDTMLISFIGSLFGAGGAGFWGGGLAGFVIGVIYQWYFLTQQKGRTPGKMLMKIRVIRTDGEPLRDADAVLRYVGYYINTFFISLGWLWAALDSDNQGWHDKIAQTYVVKDVTARKKQKNTYVNV